MTNDTPTKDRWIRLGGIDDATWELIKLLTPQERMDALATAARAKLDRITKVVQP